MEIDDKLEIEVGRSLFKFDGPIGRFRFFCYSCNNITYWINGGVL